MSWRLLAQSRCRGSIGSVTCFFFSNCQWYSWSIMKLCVFITSCNYIHINYNIYVYIYIYTYIYYIMIYCDILSFNMFQWSSSVHPSDPPVGQHWARDCHPPRPASAMRFHEWFINDSWMIHDIHESSMNLIWFCNIVHAWDGMRHAMRSPMSQWDSQNDHGTKDTQSDQIAKGWRKFTKNHGQHWTL